VIPHLHLVVPGLFGPIPGLKELGLTPTAPALETLLARADLSEITSCSLESTLFDLFGVQNEASGDLPSAAVSRLAEGGGRDSAFWFHASPVFLKATADRLLLFDAEMLDIRPGDAAALVELFNQHFAQDDWHLEAPHPNRWYLRLPTPLNVSTSALADVVGRNVEQYLPSGKEAMQWRSVLNEIQMLFHSAAANLQREADHLLPVNGVWLSGGGSLPKRVNNKFAVVMADDILSQGFSQLAEADCYSLILDDLEQLHVTGSCLVTYSSLLRPVLAADPQGWTEQMAEFECWATVLLRMLQKKQIERVSLYPCNGQLFQIERRALRRFWKSRRTITDYLLAGN